MLFLDNPARKGRKRSKSARRVTRRRVRRAKGRTQSKGGVIMARRRRRRAAVRRAAPRRRRRRRSVSVVYRAAPRRRRRRHVARRVTHRRRYRRNPGGSGIVATIKQGVKDGALVLVGQAVQGRVGTFVGKMVPISGLPGVAISEVGSALVTAMVARKFLPGGARIVTAGAFSNAVRRVVTAVSPSVGGLLGGDDGMGYPIGGLVDGGAIGAYPALGAYPSLGAYPGGLGDSADNYADDAIAYS